MRAEPGTTFGGRWTGRWTNSVGETGDDTLDLVEDSARNLRGTWSGNVDVAGRQTDAASLALHARTKTRDYQITGSLRGEVLTMKYVATRLDQPGSYAGQSTFSRVKSVAAIPQGTAGSTVASGQKPAPVSTAVTKSATTKKPDKSVLPLGEVLATPAWALEPKVGGEFANLTKANPFGIAATLSGGTEVLTGARAGSARKLSPLYDYTPAAASVPAASQAEALGKAAALRGSQETALSGLHQAWQEAVIAAEYGDEAAAQEALEIVRTDYDTAMAAQNGLDRLVKEQNAAPALPDAAQEKAKANEAYRRLLARTKAAVADDAAATTTSRAGYKLASIEMPPTDTSISEGQSFSGRGTEAGYEYKWVDPASGPVSYRVQWSLPGAILPGVPAKCRISLSTAGGAGEYADLQMGYRGLLAGVRTGNPNGPRGPMPSVLSDEFDLVVPDLRQAVKDHKDRTLKIRLRNQAELEDIVVSTNGGSGSSPKTPHEVPLEDAPLGVLGDNLDQNVVKIAVVEYSRNLAVYTYKWTDDCGPEGASSTVVANEPPLPDLPPDKVEEGRMHQANIASIRGHLAEDEAELAKARDPRTRASLEWRILTEKSDLVAEQDLLASLEKGAIVHSRSPFDDYAHDRFVDSIRESQQDMIAFQRERAAIPRLLALMPADQRAAMQTFVSRQLTPGVLEKMDHAKLREIANALSNQVQGYWQGESARNTEKAEQYNDYLTRAERVKMIADTTVTIGSMGSGSLYRLAAGYAAASGMAAGGPVEAINQASQYYAAPLHAAMEAMKAYPKDGLWGATKAGAIGFVMSKMVQLGAPEGKAEQLTVREAAQLADFQKAQSRGQALVRDFEKARSELVVARDAGRPIAEVRALEQEVANRAATVQTDLHAKAFLKYKADQPLKTAFTEQIDALHNSVQTRFDRIMADAKWEPQQLRPIRNSSSVGSVNMDFDIMLVEKPGMTFMKDGKEFTMREWQAEAQKSWEQAFHDTTGLDAGHAMEELTYSGHPEAYKDLAWVGRDPTKTSSIWATQAGDVTRYKAQNILTTDKVGALDYYTRLMEAARGTAKDIDTKLLNRLKLFKNRIPGPDGGARQQELLGRWTEIQGLLKDIGEGRIDPVHGNRMVRNLSGGYDIPDVIEHASSLIGEFGKLAAKPVR
jgi:hypothetical protein